MIRHSVIFKFKAHLSSTEKQQFFKVAQTLSTIEGVQSFEILKQVSTKNGYEFGLAMAFDNADVYQKYNAHPDHTFFVQEYWQKCVEEFLEIDYMPIANITSFEF